MKLTEKEREMAFPVTIDLGREVKDYGMPMPVSEATEGKGKKGKMRKVYPTLYIDSMPGIEMLPKEGCILVNFRRKSISIEEGMDGEDKTGANLEIRSLCLPEDMATDADESLEDALKRGMSSMAEDEDDEGDEEGEE